MSKPQTTFPDKTHSATRNSSREMATVRNDEPTLGDVAGDAMESFRRYAKKRPEVVAMWCVGVGFVLGWKLKPW